MYCIVLYCISFASFFVNIGMCSFGLLVTSTICLWKWYIMAESWMRLLLRWGRKGIRPQAMHTGAKRRVEHEAPPLVWLRFQVHVTSALFPPQFSYSWWKQKLTGVANENFREGVTRKKHFTLPHIKRYFWFYDSEYWSRFYVCCFFVSFVEGCDLVICRKDYSHIWAVLSRPRPSRCSEARSSRLSSPRTVWSWKKSKTPVKTFQLFFKITLSQKNRNSSITRPRFPSQTQKNRPHSKTFR